MDALKEASKAYAEVGQISKAAETLVKVADLDKKNRNAHLELAADIYLLRKKPKKLVPLTMACWLQRTLKP